MAVALNEPLAVVEVLSFEHGEAEVFGGVEVPDPEDLLLEG